MSHSNKKPRRPIRRTLLDELFNLPNLLTLGRIAAIPFVCLLVVQDTRVTAFAAALLYSLAAMTDMVDGYLARRNKQVTLIGKFLDPLADKLIVLSILLTMLVLDRVPLWVVALILAREITITGLRSIASSEGLVIAAKPLGKYKTAFQMVGLVGLLVHYPYVVNFLVAIAELNFHRLGMAFLYFSLVFSIVSALDYFIGFARELKRTRSSSDEENADESDDADEPETTNPPNARP